MKFFEVFKAGNYPQGVFSPQDITALAANYDPKFCEAPITLDHEQKGPAFGWVSGLKAENGKLKASFRDVADELKDFVQAGKYRKVSVEIYRELEGKKPYLKAVSFLGAAIPQIKGMEPVEFKEAESDIYVFELEMPAEDFKSEIAKLSEQMSEIETQIKTFSQQTDKIKGLEVLHGLNDKVQSLRDQINKFQEADIARQKAEEELKKLRLQMRRNEFEQFLNEQIAYGNLTPNQRDLSIKILMVLDSVPQFEEGSPIDEFKEFIKALPKQVEFDEIATKKKQDKTEPETVSFENASEDSLEIYNQAKLMSEKEGIPFRDALLKLHK